MLKIMSVVGARPNFIKAAPFIHEIIKYNQKTKRIDHKLIHTGQHYDEKMSGKFFKELNIPNPDINLGIGSGSHSEQVGKTMIEFEKILIKSKPDWIIVFGDVNATLACSISAKKLGIKVCHIEAGLRSNDYNMPEEINRLVTDRLSDLLLAPDIISIDNLIKEGVPKERVKFVGNIMIDTLEKNKVSIKSLDIVSIIEKNLIPGQNFKINKDIKDKCLFTLHRPSNVDKEHRLKDIINFIINKVSNEYLIIWPMHPRTKKQLEIFNFIDVLMKNERIILLTPVGYNDMLQLNMNSNLMITDSGGLQEECTILQTPCITLRWNTERPVTLHENGGVSLLVGNNLDSIENGYESMKKIKFNYVRPKYWDGKTASRCLKELLNFEYKR